MRQISFHGLTLNQLHFGGDDLKGRRKSIRPLSTKKPLHLIIKPKALDRKHSFVRYKVEIQRLIFKTSKKWGVKIHDKSINFTYLHLVLSFSSRKQYVAFVRIFNAAIVRLLEIKTKKSMRGLFRYRPFTRVVAWGRDLKNLLRYLQINRFEAEGVLVTERFNPNFSKQIGVVGEFCRQKIKATSFSKTSFAQCNH